MTDQEISAQNANGQGRSADGGDARADGCVHVADVEIEVSVEVAVRDRQSHPGGGVQRALRGGDIREAPAIALVELVGAVVVDDVEVLVAVGVVVLEDRF